MTKEECGKSLSKTGVRTKIAIAYDQIFLQGDDPSRKNSGFWDEFFMLWSHPDVIRRYLLEMTNEQIMARKDVLRKLCRQCIIACEEDSSVRTVNAMQTLEGLIRGVCSRKDVTGTVALDLLFHPTTAAELTRGLLDRVSEILLNALPPSLKQISLNLLLTLVTAFDDLSANVFLEYFLVTSVFEALVQLLANSNDRQNHGVFAVLLIALLVNYRKHENVNPYIVRLSILDDELALNGYSNVISGRLSDHNRAFQHRLAQSEPTGLFSSFTNMVGSVFVADDVVSDKAQRDECLLLAMYEAVHLNRNFITTLTSVSHEMNGGTSKEHSVPSSTSHQLPENLCIAFLTYCSVILHDLKSERSRNAAKLSTITLACIAEDQYANALMHDINMMFRVPLYRAPMRHRKGALDKSPSLRPLACAVLDLCVEFLQSHMMKRNLPFELYTWILCTIHRILCYEKKCRIRLNFGWRDLWNALIGLLRFLEQNEAKLSQEIDVFALFNKINQILNLFITFGDTFLPSAVTYDYLYYEIIRQAEVFDHLQLLVVQYTEQHSPGGRRDGAIKLANTLVNIRSIIAHFRPKIDALGLSTLTEDTVLDVVRSNYDTLTLKLYENLDVIDRYNENPKHTPFFAEMRPVSILIDLIRLIVLESRAKIEHNGLDRSAVITELSTIPTCNTMQQQQKN